MVLMQKKPYQTSLNQEQLRDTPASRKGKRKKP